MKILCYSDTHLRRYGSFPPFNCLAPNGLTRELNNLIVGFDFVADKIKELRPDMVVFGGDLFHPLESISIMAYHSAHLALSKVSNACDSVGIQHWLIPGNHGMASEINKIHAISALGHYGIICSSPQTQTDSDAEIGMIPYISDPKEMERRIKELTNFCSVIITHSSCFGAEMESGKPSDCSISNKTGVKIISGHEHVPQDIGDWSFIGSLVQHRFCLTDDKHVGGILLYDTKTRELIRQPNTYSKHYVVLKDLNRVSEFDPSRVVFQVRVSQTKSEVDDILSKLGFEYHYIPQPKKSVTEETKVEYENDIDPELLLKNYVKQDKPEAYTVLEDVLGE